ncbi:MAG: Crp/Fnr family transcriptional regulator [Haliscomenobacter sp.]|nr:Crp/Fnr family transcriptional regulator [Haliscomenobacter sp.]
MKTLTEKDQAYVCDIQAPCFQALSPEELALLQESKTQVLFHKGETLVKQGAFASYILFLHSGIAKQYIEAEGTRNLNIRLLGPGEFAGLPAVFTDRKFSYSVAALSEVHAFLIEIDAIGQLMQHNAAFSFRISQRFCRFQTGLLANMHHLAYKQMNGRMADVLLYIEGFKGERNDIFSALSRRDIAEFAGMSTESAVKILKSFEKEGLIRLEDKDIHLLKMEKLQEVAEVG